MKPLREPLLHFAAAGAVLFCLYAALNHGKAPTKEFEPVRISQGDVQWLRQTYASQWLRQPDAEELEGLIAEFVDEQLYAREAQAMGLGENDTIVRRRLAQKLKFMVEDTSRLAEPDNTELLGYYEANAKRFETGVKLSFVHIFFNPQAHQNPMLDASAVLDRLRKAGLGPEAAASGDRFLLDIDFPDADHETISNMFGADFAGAVFALEPGHWAGPFKSGYGVHLAFVRTKTPVVRPAFDTIRDKVAKEWHREKEDAIRREYLAGLRKKYGVALDEGVKALLDPKSGIDVAVR